MLHICVGVCVRVRGKYESAETQSLVNAMSHIPMNDETDEFDKPPTMIWINM